MFIEGFINTSNCLELSRILVIEAKIDWGFSCLESDTSYLGITF